MPVRRTVLAAVVAAVALTSVLPSYADHDNGKGKSQDHKHAQGPKKPHPKPDPCRGNPHDVLRMQLQTPGGVALALVAKPSTKPRGIVVFDHGYGHTMESWREHVIHTASTLGVIAIAPNYRGQTEPPEGDKIPSRGWRVAEGAQDSIEYAKHFQALCKPTGINVVYGVSMGGNTSGLVVAAQPKRPGGNKPLFDYWVAVEPAVNVTETYAGARLLAGANEFAAHAQEDIEDAFGGTPLEVPEVYAERTVVNRTGDIAGAGLKGVVVVHGLVDGLVPHNQSRELQALLRARGVPLDFWTAVTRKEGTEPGTTIDGYVHEGAGTGLTSPFAGHASETSTDHVVGAAGFAALDRLYSGAEFVCGEAVYDGMSGKTAYASAEVC